ncbi:cation:proton antiporter domain-containing protein [Flectobacillus major]|jgi:Kef-type K+ transport system membrane component KefB|uniref:cation:proton antiporter domain-containing protein n=1 Tax=Flectobacillus major TaxID=103 RepID=UPI00042A480D|nr:cation:proton antiporter [Flectobacillus major]
MNTYIIVLVLASGVILSYIFNLIAKKFAIPSVLLLLGTGIGLGQLFGQQLLPATFINKTVEILGIVGLIMIILEASLDLELSRDKAGLIFRAFFAALFILLGSAFSIAFIIEQTTGESFRNCLVYATPLSIISSAIVIPSVENLIPHKREFIIYEASFSDILGILFFNYLIAEQGISIESAVVYGFNIIWSLLLSVGVALGLIYLLSRITLHLKYFLLFAVLLILYAAGKILHLPSLLIILFFGLLINNRRLIRPKVIVEGIQNTVFTEVENNLKSITAETAFLIRTFFFILFGYSMNINIFSQEEVWITGSLVVLALLAIRFIYLRFVQSQKNTMPELLLMPRGLITILLFYGIPTQFKLNTFNDGILFFVILITSILMMLGIMTAEKKNSIQSLSNDTIGEIV